MPLRDLLEKPSTPPLLHEFTKENPETGQRGQGLWGNVMTVVQNIALSLDIFGYR